MLPGMELMGCADLAVPPSVMQHVVRVESSFNPYAIGVVGGRLARQPRNLSEALSTARILESKGYNFSLGMAQVNRHNLKRQGLHDYETAFAVCPNLQAGSRILAECYGRSGGDWGKAFSCYYSGNFVTGYRHGYVQKVVASWRQATGQGDAVSAAIPVVQTAPRPAGRRAPAAPGAGASRIVRRVQEAATVHMPDVAPPVPAPPAPAAAVRQPVAPMAASTAPVVLQPMGAAVPTPLPVAEPAGTSRPPTGPPRDDAFVF